LAFGRPSGYLGRDRKTSHEGLGITAQEWDTCTRHATASLDGLGIANQEKREFLVEIRGSRTNRAVEIGAGALLPYAG